MKTKSDYTTEFRDYGTITVPAGTRVTNKTAMGIDKNYHFVNEFGWVKANYSQIDSILIHDLTYYGLNIPKELIEY